ncbi:hypothetical protein SASPL_114036 [Salvia splendens]|uniref:LPPG:FO 2-phospho-L-lactate transferase CofD/UPF0052 n=1 Tax=Salvia splendens TaxID=180675 RepID=A0A8X8Y2M6_SALSN|nr:hypothetical protein SASPL_114036 [Salvia splendens]
MADTCLGPPPFMPPHSLLNTPNQIPFPFLLLSHHRSSPFSRNLSLMAPSSNPIPTHHSHCSSASTSPKCLSSQPSLLVFSGGTAFNGVVEELKSLTVHVAHVLPVSDDGGSTAEIVRVLGGPAVGDIRSRCLRLSDPSTSEALAVRTLLGHRLPLEAQKAKFEWYDIVEGNHSLWTGVSKPYRETIRAFLVYFQDQEKTIICRSLEGRMKYSVSATEESLVLPVISTNDRLTLGCELWDGTIIRGQNEISHPTSGSMEPINKSHSSARTLPSRIKRVFYMSSEGSNLLHEVFPSANPSVLDQLNSVDCIIYAMGSLFTSICPSLVLRGIGESISSRSCPKVLLLNGTHDRETGGFTASCFVTAIADALNRTHGDPHNSLNSPPNQYINTIFVPKGGQILIDTDKLAAQGISRVVTVESVHDAAAGIIYDPTSLIQSMANLLTESTPKDITST